jgi:glutaredoxin 3
MGGPFCETWIVDVGEPATAALCATAGRPAHFTQPEVSTPKGTPMGRPTDIVLYQAEWCPYCARVRSKLTDLLLDYKNVNVPRAHSERDEVQKVSGQTSIPVMVDGDVILDDDDDIIPYLEKKYGRAAAQAS